MSGALTAKRLIRVEMVRRGMTYGTLANLVGDNERNVRNKVSRGTFSAAFMIQCLTVMGVTDLRLD